VHQNYDFDYSDGEDANESGSADVENMYYKAKCTPCPTIRSAVAPAE
jgi:hypothetical protein